MYIYQTSHLLLFVSILDQFRTIIYALHSLLLRRFIYSPFIYQIDYHSSVSFIHHWCIVSYIIHISYYMSHSRIIYTLYLYLIYVLLLFIIDILHLCIINALNSSIVYISHSSLHLYISYVAWKPLNIYQVLDFLAKVLCYSQIYI